MEPPNATLPQDPRLDHRGERPTKSIPPSQDDIIENKCLLELRSNQNSLAPNQCASNKNKNKNDHVAADRAGHPQT
jgi:hypothetical protein